MRRLDFARELRCAQLHLNEYERAALLRAGTPLDVIRDGLVGAADVVVETGVYQPLEGARTHIIVPVRAGDYVSPEATDPSDIVRTGDIVDLVAFRMDAPHEWGLRADAATWLGACVPQYLDPPPVLVHRTPLDWLRANGDGIVPLIHDEIELRSLLLGFRTIAVDDPAFGRRLKSCLERPYETPPIMLRVVEEAAA